MITVTIEVRCRSCGNEDVVTVELSEGEYFRMLPEGAAVVAQGKVKQCVLCQKPIVFTR